MQATGPSKTFGLLIYTRLESGHSYMDGSAGAPSTADAE
jgi:hypothetical protein